MHYKNMTKDELRKYMESSQFKRVLAGCMIFAGFLFAFHIGTETGYKKAMFESKFGEKYYQAFAPRGEHRPLSFTPDTIPGAHGTAGKIMSLELPKIIVEDFDGTEKVVVFSDNTVVRKFRDTLQKTDLRVGDYVVVIGTPTSTGEVEAKLVRVMPAPSQAIQPVPTIN
jgi:hypothetical protein